MSFKPLNTAYNSSQVIFSKFYCAYDVLSGCIKIYQEPLVIMKDLPFSSLTRHVKTKLYVFSRVPNSEEKVTNPTSRTAEFSISGQSGFYTIHLHSIDLWIIIGTTTEVTLHFMFLKLQHKLKLCHLLHHDQTSPKTQMMIAIIVMGTV